MVVLQVQCGFYKGAFFKSSIRVLQGFFLDSVMRRSQMFRGLCASPLPAAARKAEKRRPNQA